MNQKLKPELKFCEKEILTTKQEFVCNQNEVHKAMLDSPLAFVIFYVFIVLFGAVLFQLCQKKIKKEDKSDK